MGAPPRRCESPRRKVRTGLVMPTWHTSFSTTRKAVVVCWLRRTGTTPRRRSRSSHFWASNNTRTVSKVCNACSASSQVWRIARRKDNMVARFQIQNRQLPCQPSRTKSSRCRTRTPLRNEAVPNSYRRLLPNMESYPYRSSLP